jgi:hypothetical protein
MERELSLAQQKVLFDQEATLDLYRRTLGTPGADGCTCISCKNFAAQRGKVFPEVFNQFLSTLGIDPLKEWEAFDYDFGLNPDEHLYGGWFLFVGRLADSSTKRPESPAEPFGYWFTDSFPNGTLPEGQKYCAVQFFARVPWVLAEAP